MTLRIDHLAALIALCLVAAAAAAQPALPAAASAQPVVTEEVVQQRLADASDSAVIDLYREALEHLQRASAARERAAEFRRAVTEAPGRLEAIRQELSSPSADVGPEVPADATLAQLEQAQAQVTARLNAGRDRVAELQGEAAYRQERRTKIPELLAQARQRLGELGGAVRAQPEEGESPAVVEARRTLELAQRQAVAAEVDALEAELSSYDARRDLLPARRDRAARRVSEDEVLVAAWQELVGDRRQLEAERAAQEAQRLRRQTARQHPVLQDYAADSQRLAEQRARPDGTPQKITRASERVAGAQAQIADLRQQYASVQRRIDASGLNRATGLLLRRQYESLPDADALRKTVAATQRELEDAEYALIELQDDRVGVGDTERVTQQLLAEIGEGGENRADIEAVARELAIARRDLLSEQVNDAARYFETLFQLDEVTRDLLEATNAYESFIRERILWVRSIAANRRPVSEDLAAAMTWLVDPASWSETVDRTKADIARRVPATLLAALVLVGLFAGRRWIRREVQRVAELVSGYRTDALAYTFLAIGLTVLLSIPFPALLWWLGWVLSRPINQTSVAAALGAGLQSAGLSLWPIAFLSQAFRSGGLADAHFRWPDAVLRSVRRHLRWLVPVLIPAITLVVAIDSHGDEAANASLGRIVFGIGMLALAMFLQRVFRPHGPVLSELLRRRPGGWLDRLRYLWYPALVGVPVALVAVSWLGYFYTALQLESRLESTVALCLGLVLVNAVLLRWLFVARRQVAIEDARRKREQAIADAQAQTPDDDAPTEATVPAIDEDKLDLPAISLKTRQLFRTAIVLFTLVGLYAIWADTLPALRMLNRVELFPEQRILPASDGEIIPILEPGGMTASAPSSADAGSSSDSGEASGSGLGASPGDLPSLLSTGAEPADAVVGDAATTAVTLADVGIALVVLIATLVTFRNLPGLVEIVVLQRLPLDAGSRYAMSTVLRYAIAIVGVAAALGALSISWSKIQWLAAALTFGLAFGLQEIFANFVSGLIILAERPIRIGDTVTVGNVTGTVTRIRMRATTIADWDRKELVIPNKTFITGEVINWTLSDPVLRVIVPVGVSYDADVRKAEALLLQVAGEQPTVLEDPKPYVVFNRFGDSTLDFELRVFIPHIDHLLAVRHDLHMRVIETFRKAGIEIAFPQRDLHLRSVGELGSLVQKRADLDGVEALGSS